MKIRGARSVIAALCAGPLLALVALPSVSAAPPKKKPVPSVSASASVEPTPSASVTAAPVSSAPSTISSPISPLTPRPDEAPPVKGSGSSSAKVSGSYDDLMAEIAALRARVAMVGNSVWKSKMAVTVRIRGSHAKIAWAKLSLDGAQVWSGPKGFTAEEDVAVFEGGVAPGPHALTIELERRDDRDESFKSIDRTTSTVVVPNGKRLEVEIRLEDDSTMGGDFPGDSEGRYELRLKLRAKAK